MDKESLTFTSANWDSAQTVTVSAAEDEDAETDAATIEHGIAGADYSAESVGDVAVSVTDNETASTMITLRANVDSLSLKVPKRPR